MLFPVRNAFRQIQSLDGLWAFQFDPDDVGEAEGWMKQLPSPQTIAVPGSWNEQFADARDYMGAGWYMMRVHVPAFWHERRVFLRIGSANYATKVWLNGELIGTHEGGHLPFSFDLSGCEGLFASEGATLAIRVENELRPERVPPGGVGGWQAGAGTSMFPDANFDFFPYCGLHREVMLVSLPTVSIEDITTKTMIGEGQTALQIEVVGGTPSHQVEAILETAEGVLSQLLFPLTSDADGPARWRGTINVSKARHWCPEDPFLYPLRISLREGTEVDRYDLSIGLRTIEVQGHQLLLNGEPLFLKGFGKHEDFPIHGRGLHLPLLIKDNALLKWVGANSYRTAHYPYSEHALATADREGFLVIDEIPAVGLFYDDAPEAIAARQTRCEAQLKALIERDKNHPSVIMWSVANEPCPPTLFKDFASLEQAQLEHLGGGVKAEQEVPDVATEGLSRLVSLARELDGSRPVTLVSLLGGPDAWLTLGDVVCINRYWGWYVKPGQLEEGAEALEEELKQLFAQTKKPIMITECGADTIAGCHSQPPEMFSEEYQVEMLRLYLDVAERSEYIVGMHIWNFADFKTAQAVLRMGGLNHKGVFTRTRQPKMAAHYLRTRWANDS